MESLCKRNLCIVLIFDTRLLDWKSILNFFLPPQTTEL